MGNAAYYKRNREAISLKGKQRYAANPEPKKSRAKAYYRSHRHQALEWRKHYYRKNRARIRKVAKISSKIYRIENAVKLKKYNAEYTIKNRTSIKNTALKYLYGITLDEYMAMVKNQHGVCAICKQRPVHNTRWGRSDSLRVDHCDKTYKVRGLLCHNCNAGMGLFKHSVSFLSAAIKYLQLHSK